MRGLDYLRQTREPDNRATAALDVVEQARTDDGRWLRNKVYPGAIHFDIDDPEGQPGRWVTLRALRVLRWAGRL